MLKLVLKEITFKIVKRYKSKGAAMTAINFKDAFGKYLLVTNIVSSGILMGIGDICQQEIEYNQNKLPERYNYDRLTNMFIVGLSQGPLHHYFYMYLNKFIPGRTLISVVKKILMDQFVMSPVCITAFFYTSGLLEKQTLESCRNELVSKFKEVYTVDWMVWPPTQFLNFYVIPVRFQVFYVNFMTMFYNVFLSYIKYREAAAKYQIGQAKKEELPCKKDLVKIINK